MLCTPSSFQGGLFSERRVNDPTPCSSTPGNAPEPTPPPAETHTVFLNSPEPPASSPVPSSMEVWMHRVAVFLFVLISAVAGVLLIILPWTPEWTDNYLLLSFPDLRPVVSNGFFRGMCSGLGLLDIWIGFWEALHYHEHS